MICKYKWFALLVVLSLVLSACSASAPQQAGATEVMHEQGDEAMMEKTPEEMMEETPEVMEEAMPSEDAMMDETPASMPEDQAMIETPAFFKASLTDAATGETFSIQDFEGKVILVETLAMWCSTCMRQQREVVLLHSQLGEREDFVSLGLDIDPNEVLSDLTDYVARNEFDWYYAVAPVEVAREIGQLYGDQFLNPPSAPMFIIDHKGEVHPLPFGVKSADDLQKALQPFLSG